MDWLTFAKKQIRMLTKYYIEIDGARSEIPKECIKNWDEIKCVYKRADYSGVTRSFSSQFEFVGEMYDKLMALYLRDGVNAVAVLSLYVITDRWEWEEQFTCPLDFSTITWDNYILKLNCVDNSLAALIKANKGTKYEFNIGSDIKPNSSFNFDRMPMAENITYGFTNGDSYDNCADILVKQTQNTRMWMGNIGDEITINQTINWNDDQEDNADGYLFSAEKDVEVTLDYEYSYRSDYGNGAGLQFVLGIIRNGQAVAGQMSWNLGSIVKDKILSGSYSDPGQLPPAGNTYDSTYAIIQGIVWMCQYCGHTMPNGTPYEWRSLKKTPEEAFLRKKRSRLTLSLLSGDRVIINALGYSSTASQVVTFRCVSSKFVFSWLARGESVDIDVFRPETVINAILKRIGGSKMNLSARISSFDPRLANTYLMAGESVRGISSAKFYSSFNEFCDWMATVFGYTYFIGSALQSRFKKILYVGDSFYTPWSYDDEPWIGSVDKECITFVSGHNQFFYVPKDESKLYTAWSGSNDYRGPDGYPLTDRLYEIDGELFYFEESEGVISAPILYDFDGGNIGNQSQTINFVHRSEIFSNSADVKHIAHARDISYKVDSGQIYSSIVIGYEKKEYDSINGRDEFNFNNSYSTGCSVSSKKLTLTSKYRADSYGIEFTAQKRGKDTTDNQSDNNVFFVLAKRVDGQLVPDRSISIENALSDAVFNGAFSPLACLDANAGYIGMQSKALHLEFASSDGNSSIVIGGRSMSADIDMTSPLMTCGLLEFTTDDTDSPASFDDLIEIENDGWRYRGFISEVSYLFARNESVKYKLIVKDIEPCS